MSNYEVSKCYEVDKLTGAVTVRKTYLVTRVRMICPKCGYTYDRVTEITYDKPDPSFQPKIESELCYICKTNPILRKLYHLLKWGEY
jgi:hypothetical protein